MPYVRDSFWRGREWDSDDGTCRPARSRGAARSPGAASTAASTAPPRWPCSPRSRPTRSRPLPVDAVRAGPLVDAEGRPGLPRQSRQGPLLGAVAAHRPPRRRPGGRRAPSRCSSTATWSRPWAGSSGAARPTTATTRPRRWRSSCAPRRGAAAAPASSAPHVAELIGSCWRATSCTGCAPPRASSASPTHGSAGSTPPAPGRSRSATRPIAP